ncbi:hypothetical protein KW803_03690 [Candidatus Saccharibacteria bacterium]|nr:hypothetical protein [Candidatus Saccharibacteria bacterium]
MAKRVSRKTQQQVLMQTWWVRLVIALVFLMLSYGFISLAIDSGNLFEYAAAIVCFWYALHNSIRTFRLAVFN